MQQAYSQSGHFVVIGGLPGGGKTTLGLRLLGLYAPYVVLIDPEATRAEVLGLPVGTPITKAEVTLKQPETVARMQEKAREGLAQGKIVILPTSAVNGVARLQYEQLAREVGAEFHGFWLEASTDVHLERLHERAALLASGHRGLLTLSQVGIAQVDPGMVTGDVTWQIIDAARPKEMVFRDALCKLPTAIDIFGPKTRKASAQQVTMG